MFEGASPRITEGLFLEGDAWLDPDQAVALLTDANERLGVSVVNETVREAGITGNEVVVTTDTQDIAGTFGILATGAHALPLGLRGQGVQEVRPVRGMTIRVQGPDRSTLPTIRAFVRGRSFYIVGRSAGYCVLGASSDEQEQLLVEVGDLHRLLRDGLDIIPSLENASFIETRQGLRPASKNLEPFFEVIDERWAWSSGHYRHGVTLAPLAAQQALAFSQGFA
jgi:glycine oxidase